MDDDQKVVLGVAGLLCLLGIVIAFSISWYWGCKYEAMMKHGYEESTCEGSSIILLRKVR